MPKVLLSGNCAAEWYGRDVQQRSPVRERARRAMRSELAMLAQDLFVTRGYEQTTIEDLVSAAGISKRTFFRYFTSKEDLVLDKRDVWVEELIEAFAARPDAEPVWHSLRRAFDVVVAHFDDATQLPRTLAVEKVIQDNSALGAGELERLSRVQDQLADLIGQRIGQRSPADPRPSVLAGGALSCLIAAKNVWIASGRTEPLSDLLDEAMATLKPA
ncbi:transcriptional regulator, TetR family [Actinoplanes regularis]|uniref:Transcriptional regulator, TetR family n=1 Tax=Actinoplanes regularis TaxID=52697 RepID=A0A238W0W0_9ACTN|nr:TetR family transcriptional regulator [Actinoplanes regularis]SNR40004.1 transcriptional regulator, TetR family [Actinoplanes regularis]